jgi:hypothetical protein
MGETHGILKLTTQRTFYSILIHESD